MPSFDAHPFRESRWKLGTLLAEAPDTTGPTGSSLSAGPFPWPHRRVSCLGGPELVRLMLLFQLGCSMSWCSPIMGWLHAALTSTYCNDICTILLQLGAAHDVMVDETKPYCWNQSLGKEWIARDCPLRQTWLTHHMTVSRCTKVITAFPQIHMDWC